MPVLIDCHSHSWKLETMTGTFRAEMDKFLREAGKEGEYQVGAAEWDDHARGVAAVVDRAIVFGLQANHAGINVPNDYIADYVKQHPDKLAGFCSVDPSDPNAYRELQRSYHELGLKGLKVGPIYQDVHPHDRRFWPLYRACNELKMPIVFHQGSTTPRNIHLLIASPMLIEDIAIEFPDLQIQIAHMGHPFMTETIQVLRKQPNVVADVSCIWPRPWQFYNAVIQAQEYNVTDKLVFGSDFPFGTPQDGIDGLNGLNRQVEGTNLPRIRDDVLDAILHRNAERIYDHLWT
jgi:predicted TIM-barrel fold metal-dependent hydrolase